MGTEDVGILVLLMNRERFTALFNDLVANGFWCYQSDSVDEVYPYIKELDYVELYAKKLRDDNSLFEQQKRLIESQLQGSSSLFTGMFSKDFKIKARNYLRGIGLI